MTSRGPATQSAFAAAAFSARCAYGQLLALLARRTADIDSAEDALAAAFEEALHVWPEQGVPERPEAWLLTSARRNLLDQIRRATTRQRPEHLTALATHVTQLLAATSDDRGALLPDERLRMMFGCAHPAIDPAVRGPLILQVVLGVDAASLASAFLVSPATMAKRLVRAKAKIRASGIRFEAPEPADVTERLHAVLEAIYAAYFVASESSSETPRDALRDEAVYLSGLVRSLTPEPEALGLEALLLFVEARRPAQSSPDGELVPLLEQDTSLWSRDLLERAYGGLAQASPALSLGPFQLEAAIQGAHCCRAYAGSTPWPEIASLYDELVRRFPNLGAATARVVARARAGHSVVACLDELDRLPAAQVRSYQPFWVARSHLLELAGRTDEATTTLVRAIALTLQPARQRYLRRRLALLGRA